MKLDVAGRVALVTGARQGIGQAVTRAGRPRRHRGRRRPAADGPTVAEAA